MKILITGSNSFIGKNLISELKNKGYKDLFEYNRTKELSDLDTYTKECEFVFHFAGISRPAITDIESIENEYHKGNTGLTADLISLLRKNNNKAPILMTSSRQAILDNAYGRSKKAAEDLLFEYSREMGIEIYIYRLTNTFGKWSRPNYNNVVATYCYNTARDIAIRIDDPDTMLCLCYIDDVIKEFVATFNGNTRRDGDYCIVNEFYNIKLGELAEKIQSFKNSRKNLNISSMGDKLSKKLYSTYLSFLPENDLSYKLKMNVDSRGSFTEFQKINDYGQISVNISRGGVTKGNHWHHTKNEKFLVVSGEGLIRLRQIHGTKILEYKVSGEDLNVVDIPPGYTHSITNTCERDLITLMWANEIFDPEVPDTYYLEI